MQDNETAASAGSKRGRPSDDGAENQADDETAEPPSKKKVVEAGSQTADVKRINDAQASSTSSTITLSSDAAGKAPDAVTVSEEDAANDVQPSETEDLTALFSGWFDTTNAGLKTEAQSYANIAEALKVGCDCSSSRFRS